MLINGLLDRSSGVIKAIIAAFIAGGTATITALGDNAGITSGEWISIVSTFLVAGGGVWLVPNVPKSVARYGKMFTALVLSGLGSLATALVDGHGVSSAEWITIVIAILGPIYPVAAAENTGGAPAPDPAYAPPGDVSVVDVTNAQG